MAKKVEPVRISDVVYRVLRRNLLSGNIPAQARLLESEVARRLEVSRVPARAALARLAEDGLIAPAPGRGYISAAETGGAISLASGREALELTVTVAERKELEQRNWRQRLFDDLEMEVAAALPFGSFRIGESGLAAHLGVSRTVAREFLSRLDRAGIVQQLPNGRWRAGPLSAADIGHHYAIRQALEPLALAAAAEAVPKSKLNRLARDLQRAAERADLVTAKQMLALEKDLHVGIVLQTPNRPMAAAIQRSQLPLLSTHISLDVADKKQITLETIKDHLTIIAALLDGDGAAAAHQLSQHLVRAEAMTYERLSLLSHHQPPLPGYLDPVG